MVNHFASLLANFNLIDLSRSKDPLLLAVNDAPNILLGGEDTDDTDFLIAVEEEFARYKITRKYNNFINNNFTALTLPEELLNFYQLIFPKENNLHQNQFLLYSYLTLIDSTTLNENVKFFDSRITYDLKNWENYFKFLKINYIQNHSSGFNLSFFGNFDYEEFKNLGPLFFDIQQKENTSDILTYSRDLKKFFKEGKQNSDSYLEMYSTINYNPTDKISNAVQLGNSGLFFRFSGGASTFTETSNKNWNFLIEYPYTFDFLKVLKNIEDNYMIVERMLNFNKEKSNSSYSNIWQKHYNSVYKFSGLLMSYVERVNSIWLQRE